MNMMKKDKSLNDSSRYDNLKIARLIRRQERQYTQHIKQHKKEICSSKAF